MHQESNCIREMIEIRHDVPKMRSLEHDQCFWIQMLFNEETHTTTIFIYSWSVN